MDQDVAAIASAAEDAASPEDWRAMTAVLYARDTPQDRTRLRRLVVLTMQATADSDPVVIEEAARRVIGTLRGRRLVTSYRPRHD